MIEGLLLQQRLDAVRCALREWRCRQAVVGPLWAGALVAGLLAWQGGFGWRDALWVVPLVVGVWVLGARWRAGRTRESDVELARRLEAGDAEFDARLITAVAVLEKRRVEGEALGYLERRVVAEALDHGDSEAWISGVTGDAVRSSKRWAVASLYVFAGSMLWLTVSLRDELFQPAPVAEVAANAASTSEEVALSFDVTPGDVEVELGARLVVEAKAKPHVPADATLVWMTHDNVEVGRSAMPLGVDGETFGGMISRVGENLRYRVESGEARSESYEVTTFVYPKMEKLDVTVVPPAYTGLGPREIRNTLKVTAPEQSELRFLVSVNKPVKEAELFGEDKTVIKLSSREGEPTLLEGVLKLEKSQRYRVHLVDDQERANVKPPWITLTAQANALAKIEVVFPKRDLQVSPLQELPVEARVWDDIGVVRSGATVMLGGDPKDVVFAHEVTAPNKKLGVKEMLALESEGVAPRHLVSYHFWAEDRGPKGEVRRAMSDMFFAQVRHYEDIFRESEAPPPSPGMPGEGKQAGKLMELQKQVVNANWRVLREAAGGKAMKELGGDVGVVRESQSLALEQTKEEMEEAEDPEAKTALTEAWKAMREALEALEKAEQEAQRTALTQALEHEQAALQWLYQASEREHLVTRQNSKQPSSGAGQKERDSQLMNLELKQEEQRYEEEKQAMAEQTAQQQENLEVLNRLKELARRQEALAKKMQEMRNEMAKATSESEKQELADQLQRLQEEQENLLQGLDDLKEQMQQSDQSADLAETQEQLDKVREQALNAAEELKDKNLTDASNAATRAQRDLEQMEEAFREKTARRFSEEMRQMKQEAQEVAKAQQRISDALENQKTPEGAERGDTSNALERMLSGSGLARELGEQEERVKDLLESMRQVSEQAEGAEPILSRRLYEAVRSAQSGGLEERLEEARMESRYGNRANAQEAERKAATAVEQLSRNVEKAAEAVLGSETEALRMARNELDRLIEDVKGEAADAGAAAQDEKRGGGEADKPGRRAQAQSGRAATQEEKTEAQPKERVGERSDESMKDKSALAGMENTREAGAKGPGEEGKPGEQPGDQPGQGTGKGAGDPRDADDGKVSKGGKGNEPAKQPSGHGKGEGKGEGKIAEGAEGSEGQAQGQSAQGTGRSPGAGMPGSLAEAGSDPRSEPAKGGGRQGEAGRRDRGEVQASGGGGAEGGGWFFDESGEGPNEGPLTGDGYRDWSERLTQVEELLADPELANEAARVADDARAMRLDHSRNDAAPQADILRARITQPLVELRNRVAEALARKGVENPNVPIDRDPVPPSFRELVRRYYTELGEGN
jgi:uncharacterized protein YukE